MNTWNLRVPENPTRYQVQKAIADRIDMEKKYSPIQIPNMSYPASKLKDTSLKAFLVQIKGIMTP